MPLINVSGWNVGCNTVAAIKAIRERAGVGLGEAHAIVNRVLNGETVSIATSDPIAASILRQELENHGMVATLENPQV